MFQRFRRKKATAPEFMGPYPHSSDPGSEFGLIHGHNPNYQYDGSSESLPPDWTSYADPISGTTRFRNLRTGQITTEIPRPSPQFHHDHQQTYPQLQYQGSDTNEYFANNSMAANSFASPSAASGYPNRSDQSWEPVRDLATGNTVYRQRPSSEGSAMSPAANTNAYQFGPNEPVVNQAQQPSSPAQPQGWAAFQDQSSGRMYYRNLSTGESTWEKPSTTTNQEPSTEQSHQLITTQSNQSQWGASLNRGLMDGSNTNNLAPVQTASSSETPNNAPQNNAQVGMVPHNVNISHHSDNPSLVTEMTNHDRDSPLPAGWERLVAPLNGMTYYKNTSTGETTWKKPKQEKMNGSPTQSQQLPSINSASSTSQSKSILGWQMLQDPMSGQTYYRNEQTNELSWQRPPSQAEEVRTSPETRYQLPQGGWEALQDPASGRTFYRNTSTNETTWQQPSSEEQNIPTQKKESPLPPGWNEMTEHSTGKKYYANAATGETSWEKPYAMNLPKDSYQDNPAESQNNDERQDDDSDEFFFDGKNWVRKSGYVAPPPAAKSHSCFWLFFDMR